MRVHRWNIVRRHGVRGLGSVIGLLALVGCGAAPTVNYGNRVTTDAAGRLTREQIETIVLEADLTQAEKQTLLRNLGIEDDKLIFGLLKLAELE